MVNSSSDVLFTLSGFNETMQYRHLVFSVCLVCYFLIVFINITLVLTVILEKSLHEPMYIFLCNLCINGVYSTTGFYPKFLADLLSGLYTISYSGCLLQIMVIYSSVQCDYIILTAMAYDRYVAICRPLEYHTIMTSQKAAKLLLVCWIVPLCSISIIVIISSTLILCGFHIDKLYCENWSIVKLSCFPSTVTNVMGYTLMLAYFSCFLYILYTYFRLIRTCWRSNGDKSKFMQTCVPHVLVLCNVTIALLFDLLYTRYGSRNLPQNLKNFMAIEFLVIPPLINPLIYGLQLTKVRNVVLKVFYKNYGIAKS
ncbi:olfactory receptor 11H6-like [Denticeps clupeoides]|uniref:olfactory receptor 11H6-like n=1 Tax=Denticeps clupeoides TaxID=299321 RepID=UPI0010A47E2A|nr:olfactory receptor 11H6-like [Denticeps clupeoides]XP_028821597.1 olfactory receptor 11H6-like [Denticeps clupeoides]